MAQNQLELGAITDIARIRGRLQRTVCNLRCRDAVKFPIGHIRNAFACFATSHNCLDGLSVMKDGNRLATDGQLSRVVLS